MADADFWRNLAADFEAIPQGEYIQAEWQHEHGDEGSKWALRFPENGESIRFEVLAIRAVRALGISSSDPLGAWLNALWNHYRSILTARGKPDPELEAKHQVILPGLCGL